MQIISQQNYTEFRHVFASCYALAKVSHRLHEIHRARIDSLACASGMFALDEVASCEHSLRCSPLWGLWICVGMFYRERWFA